jgi:predicted alpha-1,2-mannosidase
VVFGAGEQPADDTRQLTDFSLWDTYRTVHPLYALLSPPVAFESARSLERFHRFLGAYPRWPIAIGESGTMLGASAEIVIADVVARVSGVGLESTWQPLLDAATAPVAPPGGRGGREHVEPYMQYGYVPSSVGRSVSVTTEYSHDDFALATIADAAGDPTTAAMLRERRKGWRALYDPAVGFLRARAADGSFAPSSEFDPLELSDDYAEANAWHSLWMAGAHDPEGLIEILGGRAGAVDKLTTFFVEAKHDWDTADEAAANFPRPYYWHGNEPDINAPWLFSQLGRPDLSQEWSRWVMTTHYNDTPTGVAGNDDGGTLGSWYVLSALGLYPIPGSDRWIVGAPLFPQARVVTGDIALTIVAEGTGPYVESVAIDGVPLAIPELTHAQLGNASELRFVLSETPTTWGRVD